MSREMETTSGGTSGLLRGVNVGGHRAFRPAMLAAQLKHLGAVNIGTAFKDKPQGLEILWDTLGQKPSGFRCLDSYGQATRDTRAAHSRGD